MILSDGTARYVYGHERLFGDAGSARTWYLGDALGSVRTTLDDAGVPLAGLNYDPWGTPQTPAIAPFGFTGELQQGGAVYLRARWYDSVQGAFGSRDPFVGYPEQPFSLHPYQYGYAAPTIWTDPSGLFVDPRLLQEIYAWQRFYSKDGWANCANRPDDGISNNDGVLDLFIEDFICEYGPADRVFGFDAPLTRELSLSRAIGYLRDQFYKSQGAVVKGGPSQMSKLQGLEAKFYDSVFTLQPISLTDFLGGFDSWTVTKDSFLGQSTIRFEIRNTTSLASGTRNPFARAGSPISMEQYVQNPSQYNWNQTDHAVAFLVDGRYSINTVLSEKPSYLRNPSTKTGLGGGNTTQTFIWEEPYDECYKVQQLDPGLPLVLLPSL